MVMALPQALVLSHPTVQLKALTAMEKAGWIGSYADDSSSVLQSKSIIYEFEILKLFMYIIYTYHTHNIYL